MRHLTTITLLLFMTCGYTQSNKFFGPESDTKNAESDTIKVKKIKKKLKFGVSVGLGSTRSTILTTQSVYFRDSYAYSGLDFDLFKRQTINSLPNFNLILSKSFKKNSILFTPGIRTITAKLKPINSTISNVFFGINSSDSYLFKELKVNQLLIDLPIIYNIKLNNIFSINLGLSTKLPILANFLGKHNAIIMQTNNENLIQKVHYNSDEFGRPLIKGDTMMGHYIPFSIWQDAIVFPKNFNIDDLSYEDRVTIMDLTGTSKPRLFPENILTSIIGGVEFSFNKKNRINFNYRICTSPSTYTISNIFTSYSGYYQGMVFDRSYDESKAFLLQFFEINYIHIF